MDALFVAQNFQAQSFNL